jgi:hypothetical protein
MYRRVKLSEDWEKCRLRRSVRMRLGKDIITRGLNPYEIAALVRAYGCLEMGC